MVTAVEVADVAMAAEAEAVATAVEAVGTAVEAGVAATAVARAVPVATTTAAKSNPSISNGAGSFPAPFFLPPLTFDKSLHGLDRIRLLRFLVRAHPDDPRESQRES